MNPFAALAVDDGLRAGEQSAHYGRYRLVFEQVFPMGADRLCAQIEIRAQGRDDVAVALELRPAPMQRLFRLNENDQLELDLADGGPIYCALETIYSSIRLLAEYLRDTHFFLFSTGDDDDRWLDEYRIIDGELQMERHILEAEWFPGVYDKWLELTPARQTEPGWEEFIAKQIMHAYRTAGGSTNPICESLRTRLVELYPNARVQ